MESSSPVKPIRRERTTYGKRKPTTDPDATLVPSAPAPLMRKRPVEEDIVPDSEPSHDILSEGSDGEEGAEVAK